jgi:hypothetical protein
VRLGIVLALAAATALVSHNSNANELYIIQSGDKLVLESTQDGGSYADFTLVGDFQTITNTQTVGTDTADYQWVEMTVQGDYNDIENYQHGYDNKYAIFDIEGNSNIVYWEQRDSGPHTAYITTTGDGNVVYGQQQGSGNHYAELDLTSSSGSYTVNFLQDSSTDQSYSLTGICTNSNGCALNITQNQ